MSEFKGTPGPWTFGPHSEFGYTRFYVSQADGAPFTPHYSDVASLVVETVADERRSIQEANARLIAAAPDLLSHAASVIQWWDEWLPKQKFAAEIEDAEWDQFKKLRDAIAKATGES